MLHFPVHPSQCIRVHCDTMQFVYTHRWRLMNVRRKCNRIPCVIVCAFLGRGVCLAPFVWRQAPPFSGDVFLLLSFLSLVICCPKPWWGIFSFERGPLVPLFFQVNMIASHYTPYVLCFEFLVCWRKASVLISSVHGGTQLGVVENESQPQVLTYHCLHFTCGYTISIM